MLRDFRYATRTLLRSPGFTTVAVLTLALGIGASTAIYTLLERVVLDPLPYPESERLVRLKNMVPGVGPGEEWQLSMAQYFFLGEHAHTLEGIGAYRRAGVSVATAEGPQRARLATVSAGALHLLGARPALGRIIDAQDDRPDAPRVAVLSHGFWQRQFGGDPGVVGRILEIQEQPVEVVGVMAAGVDLPPEPGSPADAQTDIWAPMQLNPAGPFYNNHVIPMFARLRPGVSVEESQAELDRLTPRLPEVFPDAYSQGFFDRYGFRTIPYPLKSYIVGNVSRNLWILLGAVGLVLLIACANVANLFLVRVEGRRRELAIRSALGAGRRAIARQLLAESLVLALASGVLALVIGFWGMEWLISLAPATLPRLGDLRLDGSIFLFALGLSLLVALAIAGFPVLRYRRAERGAMLADGGRGATAGRERQRARATLVVVQVALALVLIVGAGLLVESFRRLSAVDPGINPEGVLTLRLHLPGARYDEIDKMWHFYRDVLQRVEALPGVEAAGMSQTLPFTGGFGCTVQGFEDSAVKERLAASELTSCAGQEPTTPGYFEAMGIPLLKGRGFTYADNDQPATGAVVVSKAFAERFWPGEDPLGKGVSPGGGGKSGRFYRVVGVVGNVYASSLAEEPAVAIYYPIMRIPDSGGWWPNSMYLSVRTNGQDPMSLFPSVRRVVRAVDPGIPVANVEEMGTILDRSLSRLSFTMALLGVAAAVALLLAAVGLYGVISYVVSRRTHEIGVRMALGARPEQVERLVVGGSVKIAALGLAAGVVAALGLTRLMQNLLYGVETTLPAAYAAAVLLLSAVTLLASYLPARRAARVDPVVALRQE